MLISRTQNQPNQNQTNFRAKTMYPDSEMMKLHLRKRSVDVLELQAKKIETHGDDATTMHIILYNPSKTKPFGVFTEMKDQSGRRVIKLRENLRVTQLADAAQKSYEKALKELTAPLKAIAADKNPDAFQNRQRIQNLANSMIYKNHMPPHPQRPQ